MGGGRLGVAARIQRRNPGPLLAWHRRTHSYALLPIGYPMGRFGPVRRIALTDVVFEDQWGQAYRDL